MLDIKTALDLEKLAEEAAEIIQIKSKIIQFGLHDYHPKNDNIENVLLLEKEIGDFLYWVHELEKDGVINIGRIHSAQYDKKESADKWREYAIDLRG